MTLILLHNSINPHKFDNSLTSICDSGIKGFCLVTMQIGYFHTGL